MGSRVAIDSPNALQKGDRVTSHVVETWHAPGLFSAPVLGTDKCVATALNECVVLQHHQALVYPSNNMWYQSKPVSDRDEFNSRDPSSVFFETMASGAQLIGGGIECGMQPAAEGAVSKNSGLRPGCLDARGDDWDGAPVRGHKTPCPAQYKSKGCRHLYFRANWCLKKHGEQQQKQAHLTNMLFQVASALSNGEDMHVHCIPLLFPFPVV